MRNASTWLPSRRAACAAIGTVLSLAAAFSEEAWAAAQQQATCVPFTGLEFGPLDYRSPHPAELRRVELFHYNKDVELLRKGQSSVNIGEDLEFVLRYFPNHVRALNSMMQLGKREKTNRPRGNRDTIDCWFQRARVFRPDDGMVSLIYALWLVHRGDKSAAIAELEAARASTVETTGTFEYNLGLAYLEVGDYEKALQAAHKAYALGYSLPGLRNRLTRAGKWQDPPSPPPSPEKVPGQESGRDSSAAPADAPAAGKP